MKVINKEIKEQIEIDTHGNRDLFEAYIDNIHGSNFEVGGLNVDELLEEYHQAYGGQYNSMEAFAEHCVNEGLFGEIPKAIVNYIDYEKIARDLQHDYFHIDGHVFRN